MQFSTIIWTILNDKKYFIAIYAWIFYYGPLSTIEKKKKKMLNPICGIFVFGNSHFCRAKQIEFT